MDRLALKRFCIHPVSEKYSEVLILENLQKLTRSHSECLQKVSVKNYGCIHSFRIVSRFSGDYMVIGMQTQAFILPYH